MQTINIYPTRRGQYRLLLNTWDGNSPAPVKSQQVGKFDCFCKAMVRKEQLINSLGLIGRATGQAVCCLEGGAA